MKHAWSIVLATFIGLAPSIALSQTADQGNANLIKLPAYQRFQELRLKLDPSARCSFDAATNSCRMLSGKLSFPKKAAPRIVVEDFVKLQGPILRIEDLKRDFNLVREAKSLANGPTYLTYQQHINGVPVFGGIAIFAVGKDGVVRRAETQHLTDVQADLATTPSITKTAALKILEQEAVDPASIKERGLFYYSENDETGPRLVWIFEADVSGDALMHNRYIIDSISGDVIKESLTRYDLLTEGKNIQRDWAGAKLDMLEYGNELYFHTGLEHAPVSYWIKDPANDTVPFKSIPAKDWPPAPDSDMTDPITHANLQLVLDFYKSQLDQVSYCTQGQDPSECRLKIITGVDTDKYAGVWRGRGNIRFSKGSWAPTVIGHEIGHGIVGAYIVKNVGGYCEDDFPEAAGIEEGVVEIFGVLSGIYSAGIIQDRSSPLYRFTKFPGENNGTESYADRLKLLMERIEAGPQEGAINCGSHAFGGFVHSLAKIMVYGVEKDDFIMHLDAGNLLTLKELGWLFIETVRQTQSWKNDMPSLASAMLAVCREQPEMFTEEKCKNAERAFLSVGVTVDGGYGVELLGEQGKSLPAVPVDISVNKLFMRENNQLDADVSIKAISDLSMPHSNTIPFRLIATFPDDEPTLERRLMFVFDKLDQTLTLGRLPAEFEYVNGLEAPAESSVSRFILQLPAIDRPRKYSLRIQPITDQATIPQTLEITLVDTNASNDTAIITLAPNFVPEVKVSLAPDDQPRCFTLSYVSPWIGSSCKKKWNVEVSAVNNGSRPAFPLVSSILLGPNLSRSAVEARLAAFKEINEQKSRMTPKELSIQPDVLAWRENGYLKDSGCPPNKEMMRLGETFCVAKYNIIARDSDEFTVMITSPIPESTVYDNVFTFKPGKATPIDSCKLPFNFSKCLLDHIKSSNIAQNSSPLDTGINTQRWFMMNTKPYRIPSMSEPLKFMPSVEPEMLDKAVFELLPAQKGY